MEFACSESRDLRTRLAQEVVAAVASGMSVTEAATIAAVTRQTVYTWRSESPLHTLRGSVLKAHGLVPDDRVDRAGRKGPQ